MHSNSASEPESDPPVSITPLDGGSFACDLRLLRLDSGTRVATWTEWRGQTEWVCWRSIKNLSPGPVRRVPSLFGHPASPRFCKGRLIWCEYLEGRGSLVEIRPDEEKVPRDAAVPVAPLGSCGGEAACLAGPDDSLWLLAETRNDRQTGLRLLRDEGQGWRDLGAVGTKGFSARPRLCAGQGGTMAAWDEYRDGRYRVATGTLESEAMVHCGTLPAPADCWETLAALGRSNDGHWYAARCRERLVDLNSAVNHHSELVVSVCRERCWHDVAHVDIDHAMNPWMAAYRGFRRFPVLVPGPDGVWLLWEEKQDACAMDPSLGRLCAVRVTPQGLGNAPFVVRSARHLFVIEEEAAGPDVCVATQTQSRAFEWGLPYELLHCRLDAAHEPRPAPLASNREAPSFHVRPAGRERARLTDRPWRLLFGDPHLHSRFSKDLDGEPDELYHFARDVAGLDFVAFTENDCTSATEPLSPAEWEAIRRHAETFNDPGAFTALVGWEYTLHRNPDVPGSKDSHRSVIFAEDGGPLFSWWNGVAPNPRVLIERLKASRQNVLLHHHHTFGYDLTDDSIERNVEICSGWTNGMKQVEFTNTLHAWLNRGLRLGFFGASDNHERNPGLGGALTGAWAESNTRAALFDAFVRHRIFATTGLRPDLRFLVNDSFMGSECRTGHAPVVRVTVACETPVRSIEIVRDGNSVWRRDFHQNRVDLAWEDAGCRPGAHTYYAHVAFAGDEPATLPWNLAPPYGLDAWTSPVWVAREA